MTGACPRSHRYKLDTVNRFSGWIDNFENPSSSIILNFLYFILFFFLYFILFYSFIYLFSFYRTWLLTPRIAFFNISSRILGQSGYCSRTVSHTSIASTNFRHFKQQNASLNPAAADASNSSFQALSQHSKDREEQRGEETEKRDKKEGERQRQRERERERGRKKRGRERERESENEEQSLISMNKSWHLQSAESTRGHLCRANDEI